MQDCLDLDSLEVINQGMTEKEKRKLNFKRRWLSMLFIVPAIIYIIIFCYVPTKCRKCN